MAKFGFLPDLYHVHSKVAFFASYEQLQSQIFKNWTFRPHLVPPKGSNRGWYGIYGSSVGYHASNTSPSSKRAKFKKLVWGSSCSWNQSYMQKTMPRAQFTVNLEWCASEAHTRGESLLRGHGANRVKAIYWFGFQKSFVHGFFTLQLPNYKSSNGYEMIKNHQKV